MSVKLELRESNISSIAKYLLKKSPKRKNFEISLNVEAKNSPQGFHSVCKNFHKGIQIFEKFTFFHWFLL